MIKKELLPKRYYISLVCKAFEAVTTFGVSIFVSRGLGPSLKGEYTYIVEIVNILYVFVGMGLGQLYATYRKSKGKAVQSTFIDLVFFHGLFALFLGLIVFSFTDSTQWLVITTLTAISCIWSNLSMIAVIENSVLRNLIITAVYVFEGVVLVALFLLNRITLKSSLLLYAVTQILAVILFFVKYEFRFSVLRLKIKDVCELYKGAFTTMLVVLLISINYKIDIVMMKNLSSSYHTGIYSVAGTLSNAFLLIPDSFKEVLFGDSAKGEFRVVTKKSIVASMGISVSLFVVFLLVGRFAIALLYGADYSEAFLLTIVLWMAGLPLILFKVLQPIYITMGKQKIAALFLLIAALANIVANGILIPKKGSLGAAIATTFSYSVCGFLFLIYYEKRISPEIDEYD